MLAGRTYANVCNVDLICGQHDEFRVLGKNLVPGSFRHFVCFNIASVYSILIQLYFLPADTVLVVMANKCIKDLIGYKY